MQETSMEDFDPEEKRIAAERATNASKTLHLKRIQELNVAANSYIEEEKWPQAEDKLGTLLELCKDEKINNYVDRSFLGRAMLNLAFVEQNLGKRDPSNKHYVEALSILKESLGQNHHEVGRGMLNHAELLVSLAKVEEAESVCRQALPIIETHYGPTSEFVGAVLGNLGGYLASQGKLEEAQPVLLRSLDIMEANFGRNSEYTLTCLANCVRILKERNMTEELAKLKQRFTADQLSYLDLDQLEKIFPEEQINELTDKWKEEATRMVLDPPGMMKNPSFHKQEIKHFLLNWQERQKGKLDPDLVPSILAELESLPEDEVEKLTKSSLETIVQQHLSGQPIFQNLNPDDHEEPSALQVQREEMAEMVGMPSIGGDVDEETLRMLEEEDELTNQSEVTDLGAPDQAINEAEFDRLPDLEAEARQMLQQHQNKDKKKAS